ncbi:MAG: hypothetical protein FWE46_00490 [Coriobacteriia bacterium]|nr:hypothetical protein [Coriobacteriia bacterium]MCL2536748.1 hypothetical protein [Coriobacteriia bacterium]
MSMSWFKNDEGSTSLTVVLGITLSLVLLASSVQWYWINSSSSDIQSVADISVLAASDVTAKSVMFVQALDAILMTANLFGLVLYALTIVSGVNISLTGGVAALGASAFFARLLHYNKEYAKMRRSLAKEFYRLASWVNVATPYLAAGQAYRVGAENAQHLAPFNDTSYLAVAIPFPVKGELSLSDFSHVEEGLHQDISEAAEDNATSAEKVKSLEDQIEKAIDECFRLDVFKPAGTTRPHWDPLRAIDDFERGWKEQRDEGATRQSDLRPLSGNDSHRSQLQQIFDSSYRDIGNKLDSEVGGVLSRARSSKAANCANMSASSLMASHRQTRIFMTTLVSGRPTAYHLRSDCRGLSNAGETNPHRMETVMGDTARTPCLLCRPPHWQAIAAWEAQLGSYVQSWNAEAAALRHWYALKNSLESEREAIADRSKSAFDQLLKDASSYLRGGRLSYTPAGARGHICVVVSTSQRNLPTFSLPGLTDSGDVVLGHQLALSAARMMPSESESTIPQLLSESADAAPQAQEGLGAVMGTLVNGGQPAGPSGLGSGALFALSVWGSCLEVYTSAHSGLHNFAAGLPLGLDTLAGKSLASLEELARVSPPDLRRPVPTLVNTAEVGDLNAAGIEGGFARFLGSAKSALNETGAFTPAGMAAQVSRLLDELDDDLTAKIDEYASITVLGTKVPLPFGEPVQKMAATAFASLRSRREELFAALGG